MLSTDEMSTELISRSIPSTSTSGSLLFQELFVRMMISGSSSPGIPEVADVMTPGKLPVRAAPRLVTPPARSSTFPVVCVMEPTTEAFFCWPYPTTTTSSNCWELSSKVTRSGPPSVTFTSCGFIPTNEITSTALSGTIRVKLPSMSEIVPMELLPLTTTEAPMTVSPLLSKITPFTVLPPVFCAVAVRQPNSMQEHR